MHKRTKRKTTPHRLRARLLIGLLALAASALLALIIFLVARHLWPLALLLLVSSLAGVGAYAWLQHQRNQRKKHWRDHIHSLADLQQLTPTQFELITVELLRIQGFRHVRHTGGAGDLAADILCQTPQGQWAAVQCKRYASTHHVGSPEIQKFIGMVVIHHQAQVGIFVTTSTFTQPAKALAKQHHVTLLDGPHLAWLIKEFYLPQQQLPASV